MSGFVERVTGGASPLGVLLRISVLGLVVYQAVVFTGTLVGEQAWVGLAAMWAATVALVWLFTRRGHTPLKFIVPGTLFLLVFQIYPVLYTGYVSLTNFGTGNVLDKAGAIEQLQAQATRVPADAVRYDVAVFADPDAGEDPGVEGIGLLLTDPDEQVFFGTAEELVPLEDLPDVTLEDDRVVAVGAYERLSLVEAQAVQTALGQKSSAGFSPGCASARQMASVRKPIDECGDHADLRRGA